MNYVTTGPSSEELIAKAIADYNAAKKAVILHIKDVQDHNKDESKKINKYLSAEIIKNMYNALFDYCEITNKKIPTIFPYKSLEKYADYFEYFNYLYNNALDAHINDDNYDVGKKQNSKYYNKKDLENTRGLWKLDAEIEDEYDDSCDDNVVVELYKCEYQYYVDMAQKCIDEINKGDDSLYLLENYWDFQRKIEEIKERKR